MNKKMKRISLVVAAVTVAFAAFALAGCGSEENEKVEEVAAVGTCTITIPDYCEDQQIDIYEGTTVFDVLQIADVPLATENTGDGISVEAINGQAQDGTSGWIFYVNGEMPMDYCNKVKVNDGDVIVWEYSDGM